MTLEEQLKAVAEANDELERQNERLKAALRPFAEAAKGWHANFDHLGLDEIQNDNDCPTLGDCRRAADLLAELEGVQVPGGGAKVVACPSLPPS